MSLDRSLKLSGGLNRHRNVLSRAERVAKLAEKNKFDPLTGVPLGLPKVGNRKISAGGKATKKDAAAAAAPAEAVAAAPAKGAAPVKAATAAKPAAKKK